MGKMENGGRSDPWQPVLVGQVQGECFQVKMPEVMDIISFLT
jgi:hypothetical protein